MRLAVYSTGEVVLTAPWNLALKQLEDFVRAKTPWVFKKLEYFKKHPVVVRARAHRAEYIKHKPAAEELVKQKLEFWNRHYQLRYSQVRVKNHTTRWGSCSKKGGLNFNFKIVHLPERLADYLVVHELCHLREFNHSKRFWSLVGETVPDYAARRKELKSYEQF